METNVEKSRFTESPESGTRCTEILSDTLLGYAGIHQADFNLQDGSLKILYDPHILNDEHALHLVRRASERAFGRVTQCAARGNGTCAHCTLDMHRELSKHYKKLSTIQPPVEATYHDGRMEVKLAIDGSTTLELAEAETLPAAQPVEIPQPRAIPREKLEIALTAISLFAILIGLLGQRIGFLTPATTTVLFATAFAAGGYYGLIDGIAVLRQWRLDVNLLMILAALGAAYIGQPMEGATLLFLFSLSNTLQTYAMDRSRKAIEKLLNLRPTTATVRRGSRLISLPVEKLLIGDLVLVRPGERFPIDGEIVAGNSAVDQSTITGESIPVEKGSGNDVFAGTLNGNGALEVRVTRLAKDTTLAKIVQMVEEAQTSKAQTQRMLDNFEQVYAILVLAGAILLIVIPYGILHNEFYPTFYRAMTWLVVASPCALVISTPASILSAIANGARRGILFKGGVHLEQTANLKVVAFDKTGTLTTGQPHLNQALPYSELSENALLRIAAATESRSEHPLAHAIVKAAVEKGIQIPLATDFQAIPGQGVEANVEGQRVWIGSDRLYNERRVHIPEQLQQKARELEQAGQTVMYVNANGQWLGLLAVADALRPDAAEIVADLKRLGVEHVVMLTGDNERVAASIAKSAGVDEFHAGLLPQDKVRVLKILREKYGPTAMVGDGVNDAPALASADVGVAMGGAGTDVALETADVVLMSDDLNHLSYAIGRARQARRTVIQNLVFALGVIILLVSSAFGANLPLPLGVVGHEGSTVLVVLNGLRLLNYKR
jgi:Cd2+/Zn2+-exporting ATPase